VLLAIDSAICILSIFIFVLLAMRYILLFLILVSFVSFGLGAYVPDQVLVQYRPTGFSLFSSDSSSSSSIEIVELDGESVEDAIVRLSQDPDVLHVQPNFVYTLFDFTSSFFFNDQRYLRNVGQFGGTTGADISWLSGMALFSGINNSTLWQNIVAVIDNGVVYTHESLTWKMWNGVNCLNQSWLALNGCIHGYDFYDNDLDPFPFGNDWHGTQVAGIVWANNFGIAWVNPQSRVMALRSFTWSTTTTDLIVHAINFARRNGAKIINVSFGGTGAANDTLFQNTIQGFDWLFIAAAGNAAGNHAIANQISYPCGYNFTNIICVAATNQNDILAWFSNRGPGVHVAAPGVAMITTSNSGWQTYVDGTSFAAPIVAGMASLLWSWYPDAPMSAVRQAIFSGVDVLPSLSWLVDTSGRVNVYNSLFHLFVDAQTPDSFVVTGSVDMAPSTLAISDPVTIIGIYTGVDISVSTWLYRINNWSRQWVWETGAVWSGDQVQFALTSSVNFATTSSLDFSVGLFSDSFVVETADISFVFASIEDALPWTWYPSEILTLTWFVGSLEVVVNNGEYRINGWSWTTDTGSVISWDALQVRVLSSWQPNLTDFVNISVGNYSTNFSVTTMTGQSFITGQASGGDVYFSGDRRHYNTTGVSIWIQADTGTDYRIFGQHLLTEYTGNVSSNINEIVVEFDGIGTETYIWVVVWTGGDEVYYSNFIFYDVTPPELVSFSLMSGQTVYGTSVFVTGTVSDNIAVWEVNNFSMDCDYINTDVTTCDFSGVVTVESGDYIIKLYLHDKAGNLDIIDIPVFVDAYDRTPDPFTFTAQTNIARSTVVESNAITVAGIDTGVVVSVVGGEYRIGTGAYTAATGTVSSGDTIQLRLTSSANYSTTSTAILTVGTRTGSWSVTTQAAPVGPTGGDGPPGGWCNPSSVANGTVNSSSCAITCNTWYTLSGQQCLLTGTGDTLTGDLQQTGLLLTGSDPVVMQLFTPPSGGQAISPSALVVPENVTCAPALELQAAYTFAFGLGITTMPNVSQARMCDGVLRAELAKMVAQYAMQVHGRVPDENRICSFSDIGNQSAEMQYYIRLVCQLGIMGVGLTQFNPNGLVDRAQRWTVLSRILYGNQHNNGDPYYVNHLNALQSAGIITNINPALRELRGYVMLMMMRASQ
jgi:hypothetical protein